MSYLRWGVDGSPWYVWADVSGTLAIAGPDRGYFTRAQIELLRDALTEALDEWDEVHDAGT